MRASAFTTPATTTHPAGKAFATSVPEPTPASVLPDPGVPRLCPDLSATVYGGRVALAAMAKALNKPDDEARWLADAEHIRQLILTVLYSP